MRKMRNLGKFEKMHKKSAKMKENAKHITLPCIRGIWVPKQLQPPHLLTPNYKFG